jgi:hypothetical protein
VVDDPLTRLADRNQQQTLHAGQRRNQGLRAGVIRLAHSHRAAGEIGSLAPRADNRDDIRGGHPAAEQLPNRELPKVARGSGDSAGRLSGPAEPAPFQNITKRNETERWQRELGLRDPGGAGRVHGFGAGVEERGDLGDPVQRRGDGSVVKRLARVARALP